MQEQIVEGVGIKMRSGWTNALGCIGLWLSEVQRQVKEQASWLIESAKTRVVAG